MTGSDLDVLKPRYSRVVTAIVQGEGGLPAEYFLQRLTFQQIYDVAAFVAKYAGKPGRGADLARQGLEDLTPRAARPRAAPVQSRSIAPYAVGALAEEAEDTTRLPSRRRSGARTKKQGLSGLPAGRSSSARSC